MAAVALASGLALTGAAAPVAAQSSTSTPPSASAPTMPAPAASAGVTDTEVGQYARAASKVAAIRQQARQSMGGGAQPEAQLQQQASAQMTQAVQSEGLSVDRFNAISLGMQSDPTLRSRVVAQLQPSSGSSPMTSPPPPAPAPAR
jgi:hypothetical protein